MQGEIAWVIRLGAKESTWTPSGYLLRLEASDPPSKSKIYLIFMHWHFQMIDLPPPQVRGEWRSRVLRMEPRSTSLRSPRRTWASGWGVRHEGLLDLACDMFPIFPRVLGFAQAASPKANVLRDSVLLRGAAIPFRVDTHVRAIMMHVVWGEFRARIPSHGAVLREAELQFTAFSQALMAY